eukprot:jgi/Mesvir1/25004/Mv24210-RA.1
MRCQVDNRTTFKSRSINILLAFAICARRSPPCEAERLSDVATKIYHRDEEDIRSSCVHLVRSGIDLAILLRRDRLGIVCSRPLPVVVNTMLRFARLAGQHVLCKNSQRLVSTMASNPELGFIGLGNMGSRMAANLLRKGYRLVVHDKSTSAVDDARALGATVGHTPSDVASRSEIVFTMLPSTPHVDEVYFGEHGILSSHPGAAPRLRARLLVDMSTIHPSMSRRLAQEVQARRDHPAAESSSAGAPPLAVLDAPVSGGVTGAEAASLTFMVGGEKEALDRAMPLLLSMGLKVVHCGGHGNGQVAKICNNLVLGISMAATCEGITLGQQLGMSPNLLASIFSTSSAQCWSNDKYNPCPGVMQGIPSSRDYEGGFASHMMVKDLMLALDSSKGTNARLPVMKAALEAYQELAQAPELRNKDFSGIFKYVYGKEHT